MFDPMVSDLKNGIFPDVSLLRKRFKAALVKKMGIMRTPYSFWPIDRKINPLAKELLWAAILLEDMENFRMVEAIITSELDEKLKVKGLQESSLSLSDNAKNLIQEYMREFVDLAPTEKSRDKLKQKSKMFLHAD